MKFFIRFFIFLLIVAAAAYGYAWYKNKQAVTKFIGGMNGSFDSTYLDLNGDSVIKNVRIPFAMLGSDSTTAIEEVRIGSGNPITNVKILRAIQSKQPENLPDNFEVYLKSTGESTPINSSYDKMSQALSNIFLFELPFMGCGDTKYLTAQDFFDQNINNITGDSTYTFSFSKNNKVAYLDVYMNYDQLQTVKGSFTIQNLDINNPMGVKMGKTELEIGDNGIQAYILEKCAKDLELTKSQFVERHISYVKHALFQENIFLSPEYYAEYAKYYANPRSMTFRFFPDNLNPVSLAGASPRRIIDALNTEVLINDKSITPLFGNRPDPSELPELDKVTPEDDGITTIYGIKLQDTAVSSMGKYVGYDVHFTYRGKKYKGDIISVGGSTANIRYEISTGNYVEKPFRLSEISDLMVRREQAPPTEEASRN